jgi:hypothetical protein
VFPVPETGLDCSAPSLGATANDSIVGSRGRRRIGRRHAINDRSGRRVRWCATGFDDTRFDVADDRHLRGEHGFAHWCVGDPV